ncbi:MAG: ABC transporter substrate-binding protein [Lachnospiraceae bacterium]|nr:ABC transporter substrate-binding protein [Lachnospiraceae bacterium]
MKKVLSLLLVLTMLMGLVACGASEPAATSEPETTETASAPEEAPAEAEAPAEEEAPLEVPPLETIQLNVAYMPNYASVWSVLTALDQGYFEEEGLEVTLWEFADGPSEIAAMEGGSIDLAYIGHGAHRLCINGQAQIFLPSSVHSTDKIIVLPSAGVTSVDDIANLKGKKVAYNGGSSSETALNSALAAAGLTMEDIEAYEMDATNMVAAMTSGSVDACTAWNPYSVEILKNCEGALELEFATNSVNMSSWICLPSFAEENHDALVRFTRALLKGMEFASQEDNWPYVVELYAKQCGKDPVACEVETGDANWFSSSYVGVSLTDGTFEDLYTRQQQMFIESGDVEAEVPLTDYILFDVMQEALGAVACAHD